MTQPWNNETAPAETVEKIETSGQTTENAEEDELLALITSFKRKDDVADTLEELIGFSIDRSAYTMSVMKDMAKEFLDGTLDLDAIKKDIDIPVVTEKEAVTVSKGDDAPLELCNLVSGGMSMKDAKKKLGIK